MTELSSRICPEDVVCLANDPSTPGMVCCVGDDSDSRGAPPTAHVYWLREQDNDRMEPISELTVLDRALLHGDTVMHGKRKGMVTATKIYVDMRYSDGLHQTRAPASIRLHRGTPRCAARSNFQLLTMGMVRVEQVLWSLPSTPHT